MSVLTPQQEVETLLRITLANYTEATARAGELNAAVKPFHDETVAELQKVLDGYVDGNKPVEVERVSTAGFKVGDKVRLTGEEWYEDAEHGPTNGQVVEITSIDYDWDAVFLNPGDGEEYYVLKEGSGWEGELYVEDDVIRVGDRVRVLKGCGSAQPGLEFKVREIHPASNPLVHFGELEPGAFDWYATGTKAGSINGVWGNYLEKVTK